MPQLHQNLQLDLQDQLALLVPVALKAQEVQTARAVQMDLRVQVHLKNLLHLMSQYFQLIPEALEAPVAHLALLVLLVQTDPDFPEILYLLGNLQVQVALDLFQGVLCCQMVLFLQEAQLDQKAREDLQALVGQTVPVDQCHQQVRKIPRRLVVQGDQMDQQDLKHQFLQMSRAGLSGLYLLEAQMSLLVQQVPKDLNHQVALVVLMVQVNPDLLWTQMHLLGLVAPEVQKAHLVHSVLHHQKVLGLQVDH